MNFVVLGVVWLVYDSSDLSVTSTTLILGAGYRSDTSRHSNKQLEATANVPVASVTPQPVLTAPRTTAHSHTARSSTSFPSTQPRIPASQRKPTEAPVGLRLDSFVCQYLEQRLQCYSHRRGICVKLLPRWHTRPNHVYVQGSVSTDLDVCDGCQLLEEV